METKDKNSDAKIRINAKAQMLLEEKNKVEAGILQFRVEEPSNDQKEKLKIKLLQESQIYYENNMNQFSNGMSLLAVNSLEAHGIMHEIAGKVKSMRKMSEVMDSNTTKMKDDAEKMVRKLKQIQLQM